MARQGIQYIVSGGTRFVEVAPTVFAEAIAASACERALLQLEEKYILLIGNFEELEAELLQISIRLALYTADTNDRFHDARATLDRRVANLLSSARMYIDQVPQDIKAASRTPDAIRTAFSEALSRHYDATLSYRVCEALRNYAQHRSLPVHTFVYGWSRDPDKVNAPVIQQAGMALDHERLRGDGAFKASVLKELEALADRYDLKGAIREYLHRLGQVQVQLRELLAQDVARASEAIDKVIEIAIREEDYRIGVTVWLVQEDEDGRLQRLETASRWASDRRKAIIRRTASLPHLSNFHISSA